MAAQDMQASDTGANALTLNGEFATATGHRQFDREASKADLSLAGRAKRSGWGGRSPLCANSGHSFDCALPLADLEFPPEAPQMLRLRDTETAATGDGDTARFDAKLGSLVKTKPEK